MSLSQDRTTQIHKETFTVTLQKYSPKNKYFFASFNDNRGLSLDDKTKACVDRNVGGQVESLHEVTQLEWYSRWKFAYLSGRIKKKSILEN